MMIENVDRSVLVGKPNLFTKGIDLWVLDHEKAFAFLTPFIGMSTSGLWVLDQHLAANHILYHKLKGKKLNIGELEGFLDVLNEGFWPN